MVQILRALAVIAVVMIHTTPLGEYQVFCRPFINFSVGMFIFLSGYLTKIENDNWSAFYSKRIVRVLIPYVIWTVLYTLDSRQLGDLLTNLLNAKACYHLYYILVYVQFVLLTPLLGRLAKSRYQFLGWLITPVSFIIFKYYWLLSGRTLNPTVALIWSDSCLRWFTFYYLGLILGNRIIEKSYSLKTLSLLYILSIVLQTAEGYGWLMLGEMNCGTQLKLTSLLTSVLVMLIAYEILKSGRYDIKNKFLCMLGEYSFGIYLCHLMIMHNLILHVPAYNSIPYPITSVIILLLSFGCCYIGNKVCGERVSRWLGLK
jgi:surface polysaccharide O-acyltransferase-like enzyme